MAGRWEFFLYNERSRAMGYSQGLDYRGFKLLFLFIAILGVSYTASADRSLAAEPSFPGKGAEEGKYQAYWAQYGKYLMENAPEAVKKGSDVDKATRRKLRMDFLSLLFSDIAIRLDTTTPLDPARRTNPIVNSSGEGKITYEHIHSFEF